MWSCYTALVGGTLVVDVMAFLSDMTQTLCTCKSRYTEKLTLRYRMFWLVSLFQLYETFCTLVHFCAVYVLLLEHLSHQLHSNEPCNMLLFISDIIVIVCDNALQSISMALH